MATPPKCKAPRPAAEALFGDTIRHCQIRDSKSPPCQRSVLPRFTALCRADVYGVEKNLKPNSLTKRVGNRVW